MNASSPRKCFPSILLLAVGVLSWLPPCVHAGPEETSDKKYEVEKIRNVAYYEGKDADSKRNILDLYLPKDKKDFPVVMFVHGGAWTIGSKDISWHQAVAEFFASHGIGAVAINYRLSPQVKHPEHIKDVARAFAWTHKNIKKYGGRPDCIFVAGHSAGGHLVALLATDESYLKAEGCSRKDIKGVIAVSGVYRIPPFILEKVFGNDPDVLKDASPINHVCAELPPFLIVYADRDMPGIGKMSEDFHKALKDKDDAAEIVKIEHRNHETVLFRCMKPDDPCGKAMLDFVHKYCGK